MNSVLERTGIFRFIFIALLVLFNWPLLSIPSPQMLPFWLFGVWALAVVLMWLASRTVLLRLTNDGAVTTGSGSTVSPAAQQSSGGQAQGQERARDV